MYKHLSSKSDNRLLTKGIEVLKNILLHLGHLKSDNYYVRLVYCGILLTQYSQKLAKQLA
jgi:hypothetical protein